MYLPSLSLSLYPFVLKMVASFHTATPLSSRENTFLRRTFTSLIFQNYYCSWSWRLEPLFDEDEEICDYFYPRESLVTEILWNFGWDFWNFFGQGFVRIYSSLDRYRVKESFVIMPSSSSPRLFLIEGTEIDDGSIASGRKDQFEVVNERR